MKAYQRQIDQLSKAELKYCIKNPNTIVPKYFETESGDPFELYPYQEEIVRAVWSKYPNRMGIKAVTRGGKTASVSIGTILRAMSYAGEKIMYVSPRWKQSKIMMNYTTSNLADHPDVRYSLDTRSSNSSAERLKKELSKERITFRNGSSISIQTANINQDGENLQGSGATLLVVDEIELIPPEIVRNQIMRMLGESEDAQFIALTNPTKQGFMYERMKEAEEVQSLKKTRQRRGLNEEEQKRLRELSNNPWKIKTVDWRQAVEHGRLAKSFVMEQKRLLTPYEFQMWYEAEYPDDIEDGIIKSSWVEEAIDRDWSIFSGEEQYGLDVAGEGQDLNVFSRVEEFKAKGTQRYELRHIEGWSEGDTMETSAMAHRRMSQKSFINVDAGGLGKGVADDLKRKGHNVSQVKFGKSPTKQKDRFDDYKAQMFFRLRELFQQGRISIPDNRDLKNQLTRMKLETTKRDKVKVVNGDQKSPDYADSLALAVARGMSGKLVTGSAKAY